MGRCNKREFFPDHNRLVRQVVQRLSATVKAKSSNSTLSDLSTKSLPDLGMGIPYNMGRNGHEMPPKSWSHL